MKQSEDEDKFSDFDPTTLPGESEACLNTTSDALPIPNSVDNQQVNTEKQAPEQSQPDDYMSDVSSGEDFLSAAHEHSGPEDGEYSEGDDSPDLQKSVNKLTEDCSLNAPSDQTNETKLDSIHKQTEGQFGDKEKENCETATFPPGEQPTAQASISNVLVDNASPINDEDLDSLDDFEHSDTIDIENQTKISECVTEKSDQNSTNIQKEERVERNVNNCEQEIKKEDNSSLYCHLNPEPIDSSPEIPTNWGEGGNDEDVPHKIDNQLTPVEDKNSLKVQGKPGLSRCQIIIETINGLYWEFS